MKRKSIPLIGLLACHSGLLAQTVNYTVKDFTDKLSPCKLSLTTAFNVGLEAGILAQGAVGRLGYTAMYQQAFSKNMFLAKENVVNPENASPVRYIEAGLDFFFSDRLRENRARVKVDYSSTSYSSKYFMARCHKRKLTGLHGGLIRYRQTVSASDDANAEGLYNFETRQGVQPVQNQVYYFSTSSNYLFAGLVFKKVIKCTVNSGGWNYYRHYGRRIYLDALIGGTSFQPVQSGGNEYALATRQPSPLGYRVGFEWDQMGVVTRIEIGQRPQRYAIALPGYNYFMLGFSFNFFKGDKTYAMSSKYTAD
jgi:hypothetical protein